MSSRQIASILRVKAYERMSARGTQKSTNCEKYNNCVRQYIILGIHTNTCRFV